MKSSNDNNNLNEKNRLVEVSQFRRLLPQILASTVKNFLLLDLGLSVAFPSIVIPALTGIFNEHNANEFLVLTPSQASWLGSIAYICQPIGSIASGWLSDPLGRKRSMFIVNIPHVIAWLMMFNATTIWEVYTANVLLGLGVGLMEAPIITYVGEICEPSIRGILTACAGISATLGFFFVYLLNTFMPWRTVALACLIIPVATMVAVCFIPETPLWLLSKNRTEDAQKSLQWLRGWVSSNTIANEFQALQRYSERSKSCNLCIKQNQKCPHPVPTFVEKLKELTRKRTLKPLFLVMSIFLLSQFSGILAMRPYIVQILKAYGAPINADRATVILGLMGLLGNLILLCLVRVMGKRRIYLTALAATVISCLTLSSYGFAYLPSGWTSFDKHPSMTTDSHNYLPLFIVIALNFFTSMGVSSLPWMLLSEVFPFKSRGFATGLAAALNYCLAFVATKTYYNLEVSLSIPGVTLIYGLIGVIGFVIMYKILPETENRTLEDIELHFSDNSRKITDHKIQKSSKMKQQPDAEDATVPATTKSVSVISDMIEMSNGTPSVIGTNGNCYGVVTRSTNSGCDNKAFTMDR